MIILCHLHMPLYFIGTFTEYPYFSINRVLVVLILVNYVCLS